MLLGNGALSNSLEGDASFTLLANSVVKSNTYEVKLFSACMCNEYTYKALLEMPLLLYHHHPNYKYCNFSK